MTPNDGINASHNNWSTNCPHILIETNWKHFLIMIAHQIQRQMKAVSTEIQQVNAKKEAAFVVENNKEEQS